ncbi:MAG: chemotaxis protein CheA [Opitutus sp.]|nr:chemotaxis protein CheA [Opitutus sp.]
MNGEFSPELRAELLDDFYSECDEQLTDMRRQCAALERALASGEGRAEPLHALYGRMHTFKGNAAIVGLGAAEQLAHAAEGLLRALDRRETPLSAETVDLLQQIITRLGVVVSAFRQEKKQTGVDDLLDLLADFQTGATGTLPPAVEAATATPGGTVEPAPRPVHGRELWTAFFAPTRELDARGVNVNSVRHRLAALGEILSATPTITAGGVRFQFAVAMTAPPAELTSWSADGITLARAVEPTVASAPASPEHAAPAGWSIAPSHIVRVDLSRLDELMRITGDLVIHQSRFHERLRELAGDTSSLQEVGLAFGRSLREMRQAIMRVRLVPVGEIFSRLPFVVRDLARESDKNVELLIEGQDTEIDKHLVERLKEPLLHLVRNAITHGIESPENRTATGKPPRAHLRLRAAAAGDAVVIRIEDDGRGVDAARVAERARAVGLPVPELLDNAALLALLCAPGFSTLDEASRAAGRGVGMAVVADTVRELGGHLSLATATGQGTTFTLRLPLSLSIAGAVIVSAGAQLCAVPQTFIEEIIQVPATALRLVNRVEVAPYRDGVLPVVRLRTAFREPPSEAVLLSVLVVSSDRGIAGLVVDRLHGQREIVVRPLRDPLLRIPGVAGATELGDGKPVLILDPAALTRGAVRPRAAGAIHAENLEEVAR